DRGHAPRPVQRLGGGRGVVRRIPRWSGRDRRGDRRADRRQHEPGAAGARFPRRPPGALRPSRRAPPLRRGDDRLPGRLDRRAGALRDPPRSDHARQGDRRRPAARGGRRDLMERIAPAGPVYQAGTLSGNPLAVAAGAAALSVLGADPSPYETLETIGARTAAGIEEAARRHGVPFTVNRQGSMLGLFFTDRPPRHLADVDSTDRGLFSRVFHRLLAHGVHLPPSPYEACFLSLAHDGEAIAWALDAFDRAFAEIS